jgi:GH43 family beta-xylosidase
MVKHFYRINIIPHFRVLMRRYRVKSGPRILKKRNDYFKKYTRSANDVYRGRV